MDNKIQKFLAISLAFPDVTRAISIVPAFMASLSSCHKFDNSQQSRLYERDSCRVLSSRLHEAIIGKDLRERSNLPPILSSSPGGGSSYVENNFCSIYET